MEKNNLNIISTMKEIIFLLEKNGENQWRGVLKNLLHGYCEIETRERTIKDILQIYTGGMGSFSDIVLQKNYKSSMSDEEYNILLKDNEEFDRLSTKLYNACVHYMARLKK